MEKITKNNTEFMEWWKLLNATLALKQWTEAGFKDARGCYDHNETPELAAERLIKIWS